MLEKSSIFYCCVIKVTKQNFFIVQFCINKLLYMEIIEFIPQPWPWYIAGPLVGLTVPALLILGNKNFGISANLRHACAACLPANIPFFKYEWKKEIWNQFFILGIFLGGILAICFYPTQILSKSIRIYELN